MFDGDDSSDVVLADSDTLPSGARYEVYVRRTDNHETFPSGYKYRLYYGFPDGDEPILLYDNGHRFGEHHEHRDGETRIVEFPGIDPLVERFTREVLERERQFES